MDETVKIENGFAEVGAGEWLVGRAQPASYFGTLSRRRRKGLVVRDRGHLDLVVTTGAAKCADATRPFLTHIPCAATISAVSSKVLVAPASARRGDELVRPVPMSLMKALCATVFAPAPDAGEATAPRTGGWAWVVMATSSRTARISVADGDTLSVRTESAVAWTGNRPTGFCPRLGIWDMLLPRGPRELVLHFHGPCVVWIEGSRNVLAERRVPRGA